MLNLSRQRACHCCLVFIGAERHRGTRRLDCPSATWTLFRTKICARENIKPSQRTHTRTHTRAHTHTHTYNPISRQSNEQITPNAVTSRQRDNAANTRVCVRGHTVYHTVIAHARYAQQLNLRLLGRKSARNKKIKISSRC